MFRFLVGWVSAGLLALPFVSGTVVEAPTTEGVIHLRFGRPGVGIMGIPWASGGAAAPAAGAGDFWVEPFVVQPPMCRAIRVQPVRVQPGWQNSEE